MPKPYRVVEYNAGHKGMPGMEAAINEWIGKRSSLTRLCRKAHTGVC
jgi:hypothetical protein